MGYDDNEENPEGKINEILQQHSNSIKKFVNANAQTFIDQISGMAKHLDETNEYTKILESYIKEQGIIINSHATVIQIQTEYLVEAIKEIKKLNALTNNTPSPKFDSIVKNVEIIEEHVKKEKECTKPKRKSSKQLPPSLE